MPNKSRRSSRSKQAPRWPLFAGLGVLVVATAVLVGFALPQRVAPDAGSAAPVQVGSPAPSVATAEEVQPERVAFLGDSYTGGSGEGGVGPTGWPALVSAAQGWSFDRNGPLFNAQGGTGFVQAGTNKQAYTGRVDAIIAANPTTVIVAGGLNDEGYSLEEISAAANDVFARLRAGLPDANIIVVGPFYPSSPPSEKIQQVRDAIFEAALANGITNVVDPLPWLDTPGIEIGEDGVHPTDAGHQAIADQMNAALAPFLAP